MVPVQKSLKTTFRPAKVLQPFYTGGKVALDQTGRILVTTLEEDVLITDMESGEELAKIEGDSEQVTTLALTPDAKYLIICSRSYLMRIYYLSIDLSTSPMTVTPSLERSVKAHTAPVIVAETDPTGTLLATGGADGLVKVWDIKGGFVTHNFRGHGGVVSALKFFAPSPASASVLSGEATNKGKRKKSSASDGRRNWMLATGADDTNIRIWDLMKNTCVAVLEAHVSVIRGLDWSPDGSTLVSGSRDKVVCVWDATSWKQKGTIPVLEELETVGFLAPGALKRADSGESQRVIYMGGRGNNIRLWDLREGKELTTSSVEDVDEESEEQGIVDIIYHKAMSSLLSIHRDQTILVHSLSLPSDSPVLPVIRRLSGYHDEIIDLQYLGVDENLIALATNSEEVRIQEVGKGFGDAGVLRGHEDIVICLDRDWSGTWVATGAKDNEARIWHLDSETNEFTCHATLTGHAESITAVALPRVIPQAESAAALQLKSPKFLITGSQDRTVKKWDMTVPGKKPKAVFTRKAHDKDINAIDVSPDDVLFASASQDRTVKIWSVEEGDTLGVLRGHRRGVWSVRFAPASVTAAAIGGAEGTKGGRMVVTGSGDKTVKLWSLADYSCLKTFEGHTNSVLKVVWLTGGLQVGSAGSDGLVKIWDIKSGECNSSLDNHEGKIWALTVRKDDHMLVSGGQDSTLTFWEDISEETRSTAAKVEEELVKQEQQLQNYIHNEDYRGAIVLALGLNHPGRLLSLFTAVTSKMPPEEGSVSGVLAVDEVVCSLSDSQLFTLLCRLRDWNTNARTANVAQRILNLVLRHYPASKLVELKGLRSVGPSAVWDALKSYSEKHYQRMNELVDESYMIEYTLREMEEVLADVVKDEGSMELVTTDELSADKIMVA